MNSNEPRSILGSCYNADSDSEAGGRADSAPLTGLSDVAAAAAGLSTVLQEQRSARWRSGCLVVREEWGLGMGAASEPKGSV